ncbi:ATP-binding protein [Castellaniella sp. WN]
MDAQSLFDQLQLLDESERVEAKTATKIGTSVLETVCAFANEPGLGGGWLLLGVEQDESKRLPAYRVRGISNPDQQASDLATQARTVFNTAIRLDIRPEILDGKTVLAVFVPEISPSDKPVYFKAQGLPKGAFRRIGSTDQRCTEDDLALFFEGRKHESFDASIVPDVMVEDLAPEAITVFRTARERISPTAEELHWNDDELLQSLGALRRDGAGAWQPTVAGLILFGKQVTLRSVFPMTRVDYIRVPGREWVPDPDHRFDTLELRDSLPRLVRRAQAAIMDDLPKAFGLAEGEIQRQDRPFMPDRVIREAVVNALVHRSYRSHAPVQIIRYSNRLEIRNPGFSLKAPEHLGEPGSVPRNPKIAAAMYDAGFAETKGSGIRVMRDLCREAGLVPPLFESDRGQDQFVLRLFFHHFLGEADLAWLARFKRLHLSDNEARALIVARESGALDNASYRELNRVDTLTASQALKRLRDAGLLEQKGRGSATWYQPTAEMLGDVPQEDSTAPHGVPGGTAPLPRDLGSLSRDLPLLSRNPDALAGQLNAATDTARQALLAALPGTLGVKIGSLGKRSPPADVKNVLLALLTHQTWSLSDLGVLLDRNPEYLRQKYLQPLLSSGQIAMIRPDKPNDPDQAYQAVHQK